MTDSLVKLCFIQCKIGTAVFFLEMLLFEVITSL